MKFDLNVALNPTERNPQSQSLQDAAAATPDAPRLRDEVNRLQRLVAELLLVNQRLREQLLGGEFGAKA